MRKRILTYLYAALILTLIVTNAYATTIKFAFVFIDRFPEEAKQLGFSPGDMLQVGAIAKIGGSPIVDATATNLDTGLELNLASRNIGPIYKNVVLLLHNPFPPFDPKRHLGTWEIKVKDAKGNEAIAKTHRLDKVARLPYVKNIRASGNSLAPMITWSALDPTQYPAECKIKYKVRLLKSNQEQFYATKKVTSETTDQIPEGILKPKDLAETYVRIETQCWDTDDKDQPVPVELKSETFMLLTKALEK